jgi:uncharacterized protein YgfB (UPF0149 family)
MEFSEIDLLRRKANVAINISEYHGTICAYLCCDSFQEDDLLPKEVSFDSSSVSVQIIEFKDALYELISDTINSLNDTEMSFYPFLPPDSKELSIRAHALSIWCQGFVDALGMFISERELILNQSDQTFIGEIIEDFSQISTLSKTTVENGNEEDLAYFEVVEFVRVGTQLVYEELKREIN